NTAYSVNIKERLDFSCAGFDADATLVANAPHMPVHLGSMDRAVETIIRENKDKIAPGDVYAINAPYNGGTHLPDITVCPPVFDVAGRELLFWVASRGHHADVGGISPGQCHPTRQLSRKKASTSTISSWSTAAGFASRRSTTFSPVRNIRPAI